MPQARSPADQMRMTKALCAIIALIAVPVWTEWSSRWGLAGDLHIVGSRSLSDPVGEWVTMLRRRYPHVRAHAAMFGSGLAAGEMADARADIAPLARPLIDDERLLLRDDPVAIAVGAQVEERGRKSGQARHPVYLYIARGADGRVQPAALAFARIAISDEGQSKIGRSGFTALTDEEHARALAEVARLEKSQ